MSAGWLRKARGWSAGLTIRQQLGLTASISLLVFFGSLLLFAHTTNRLLGSLYQSHRLEETMAVARNLRRLAPGIETSISAYVASGRYEFLHSYQAARLAYQYDVERIYSLLADYPEERERFEDVLRHAEEWNVRYAARSLYLRRSGAPAQAAEARKLLESPESRAALNRFTNELDLFLEWQQERLVELRAGAEADVRRMIYLVLFLGVLGTLGTLWWTSWLARSLTRPLEALRTAARRLGQPEPLRVPEFDYPPEIADLARIFNQTTAALQEANAELDAFHRFVDRTPRSQGLAETYRAFLGTAQARFDPEQVFILAADREAGLLHVAERLRPAGPEAPSVMAQPRACPAVRTSKPYLIGDTTAQTPCRCEVDVARAGSYLCVPLLRGGNLVGLVSVTGPAGHWDESRRARLLPYTDHLARELATVQRLTEAQTQAMVDSLTGLYNRRFGEEYLRKLEALSKRTQRQFGVAVVDLDYFKAFNDRFGHLAGDRLLRAAATVLQRLTRQSSLSVRWGGEEFLVILPETSAEGVLIAAERLRQALSEVEVADAPGVSVTATIGVAVYPQHGADGRELLEAADRALYRAKHAGRNRVEVASPIATVA